MKSLSVKNLVILCFAICILTGCSSHSNGVGEGNKDVTVLQTSEEKVPVASWEEVGVTLHPFSRLVGDTLYYVIAKWDETTGRQTNASVYQKVRGADEAEKMIDLAENELIYFTVDESKAVYLLYWRADGAKGDYSLQKVSSKGELIYDTTFDNIQGLTNVSMGEADSMGYLCLGDNKGNLYFFDQEGQFITEGNAPWNENDYHSTNCGLVNGGANEIFTYMLEIGKVSLQQVDMEHGSIGEKRLITIGDQAESTVDDTISWLSALNTTLSVFSGYNNGIFFTDSKKLWQYDVEDNILTDKLGWADSTINLNGYSIDALGILNDESLYALVHQTSKETAMIHIDYVDPSLLTNKEVVTIASFQGLWSYQNEALVQMVTDFNKVNSKYVIELVEYESPMNLTLELVQGKGPDLFDFRYGGLVINDLARQGILENLSPYFAKSDVIKEDDLLPAIKRAGTFEEQLVCVFPNFSTSGILVEKGATSQGSWTAEEYLSFAEKHPDQVMGLDKIYYYEDVLRNAIRVDMNSYIDWELGECYFDSERFISLINRIKKLKQPDPPATSESGLIFSYDYDEAIEQFIEGELLTYDLGIMNTLAYDTFIDEGLVDLERVEIAGYPNQNETLYYCFQNYDLLPFGMNHNAECKDGAWAFIEFFLSKEYQDEMEEFPVRRDSFERYLERTEAVNGYATITLAEDEKDMLRERVENTYWTEVDKTFDIYPIINEELQGVWTGNKTAEEAVKIIQSGVAIYIKEQVN